MRFLFAYMPITDNTDKNYNLLVTYEKLGKNQRAGDAQSFDLQDFHELSGSERRSFVKEYLNNEHTLAELLLNLSRNAENESWYSTAKLKELVDTISNLAKDFNTVTQRGVYNLFDGNHINDRIDNNEDGDTTRRMQRLFLENCNPDDLKNIIKDALNEMKKTPLPNNSSKFLENLLKNDCNNKVGIIIEGLGLKGWANERKQIKYLSPDRADSFDLVREFGLQKYNKAVDSSGTISRADIRLLTGKERENLYCDVVAQFPDARAQTMLTDLIAWGLLDLGGGSHDNVGAANIRKVDTADDKQAMANAIVSALENGIKRGIEAGVYPKTNDTDIPGKDTHGNSFYIMLYDNLFGNDRVLGVSDPRNVAAAYFGEFQKSDLFQGINQLVDDAYDAMVKSARDIVNAKEIKTASKAEASVTQANENSEAFRESLSGQISINSESKLILPPGSGPARPLGYAVVTTYLRNTAANKEPILFPPQENIITLNSLYSCEYRQYQSVITGGADGKFECEIDNTSLAAFVSLMNAGYEFYDISAEQIRIKGPDNLIYSLDIKTNGVDVVLTGPDKVKYKLIMKNNLIDSVEVAVNENSPPVIYGPDRTDSGALITRAASSVKAKDYFSHNGITYTMTKNGDILDSFGKIYKLNKDGSFTANGFLFEMKINNDTTSIYVREISTEITLDSDSSFTHNGIKYIVTKNSAGITILTANGAECQVEDGWFNNVPGFDYKIEGNQVIAVSESQEISHMITEISFNGVKYTATIDQNHNITGLTDLYGNQYTSNTNNDGTKSFTSQNVPGFQFEYNIQNRNFTVIEEYNIAANDEGFTVTTPDSYAIKPDGKVEFSFNLPEGTDIEQFKETAIYFVSATKDGDAIGASTPADVQKAIRFMQGLANIDFNVQADEKGNIIKYMERVTTAVEKIFVELGLPPRGNDPDNKNWLDMMLGPKKYDANVVESMPDHFLCKALERGFSSADGNGKVTVNGLLADAHNICTSTSGQQELFRNGKSLLLCESIHVYKGDRRAEADTMASRISSGQFGDNTVFKNSVRKHQGNNGPLLLFTAAYGLGKNPPPAGLPEISLYPNIGADPITGIKFKSADVEFILSIDVSQIKDEEYALLLAELRFLAKINDEDFEEELEALEKSAAKLNYVREDRTIIYNKDSLIESVRESALGRMRNFVETHSVYFNFDTAS